MPRRKTYCVRMQLMRDLFAVAKFLLPGREMAVFSLVYQVSANASSIL